MRGGGERVGAGCASLSPSFFTATHQPPNRCTGLPERAACRRLGVAPGRRGRTCVFEEGKNREFFFFFSLSHRRAPSVFFPTHPPPLAPPPPYHCTTDAAGGVVVLLVLPSPPPPSGVSRSLGPRPQAKARRVAPGGAGTQASRGTGASSSLAGWWGWGTVASMESVWVGVRTVTTDGEVGRRRRGRARGHALSLFHSLSAVLFDDGLRPSLSCLCFFISCQSSPSRAPAPDRLHVPLPTRAGQTKLAPSPPLSP